MNQADSMIFQTETFLNENGDKLGADRSNVEQALQQLRDAHKSGDIAAIDTAMAALNNAWQTASQQMYQGAQAGPQPGGDQQQGPFYNQQAGGPQQEAPKDDNIQDADFEEVK